MKKIMIAIGAIASLALGAYASPSKPAVDGGKYVSGTDFEFEGLTADKVLDATADDNGGTTGPRYWSSASTAVSMISTNNANFTSKFLAVDESEPLYRLMISENEGSGTTITASSSVYFSSKVQFTVSEEANGTSLVQIGSDKILIWLQAKTVEGVTSTNLIITAGKFVEGQYVSHDYVCDAEVSDQDAYKLDIKAMLTSDGIPAFTVTLGGKEVTSSDCDTAGVFPSLDQDSLSRTTITKVGFQGVGAIDDLEFGTIAIEKEKLFSVNGIECETLEEALEAARTAGAGATIKLLGNLNLVSGSEGAIVVEKNDNIVIDLAGHELSASDGVAIYNKGTIAITNSTVEIGSVVATAEETPALFNEGGAIMNIYGGKFKADCEDVYYNETIEEDGADADGIFNVYYIDNGTVTTGELTLDPETGYYEITQAGDTPQPTTYTVTIDTSVMGATATCDTETQDVAENTSLTVTATAAQGYTYTGVVATGWMIAQDGTTATYTITVTEATTITVPAAVAEVAKPTAVTGLVYDGTVQTGVVAGTGYTLSGDYAATNAGDYTAMATLEDGYVWTDGTTEPVAVSWTIAPAEVTASVSLSVTSATYDSAKTDPAAYTTATIGFGGSTLTETTDYTATWSQATVSGAGTYTLTVAPVAGSNYTFTQVTETLTITSGGGDSNWPAAWSKDEAYSEAYLNKLTAWADKNKVDTSTLTEADEAAFLLGVAPNSDHSAVTLSATAIAVGDAVSVTVDKNLANAYGVVYIASGSAPNALTTYTQVTIPEGETGVTLDLSEITGNFYQVCVGFELPTSGN